MCNKVWGPARLGKEMPLKRSSFVMNMEVFITENLQ